MYTNITVFCDTIEQFLQNGSQAETLILPSLKLSDLIVPLKFVHIAFC